ncbi:hypothetical protein ACB092_07G048800 [Castanea dentata]
MDPLPEQVNYICRDLKPWVLTAQEKKKGRRKKKQRTITGTPNVLVSDLFCLFPFGFAREGLAGTGKRREEKEKKKKSFNTIYLVCYIGQVSKF